MASAVDDFSSALQLLRDHGVEPDGAGVMPGAEVDALEKRLGVRLPPSYKAMVSRFGFLEFDTVEIYGLVKAGLDAKGIPNVVFATEGDRAKGLISPQMVRFMDAGYGPSFVLDCALADAAGEAPVFEVSAGGSVEGSDRVADSFGAFVLAEAKRLVGLEDDAPAPEGTPGREEMSRYWKKRAGDFE
ncbi:MAG: SMI1/KNR4 family protein [Mesorhizobium amorphae]|nr:MAG: SMI1/KNR4 family protein [Mesorhizobium amorphae]